MPIEVERKFRVASLAEIERRVEQRGAAVGGAKEEVDTYFAHPARDFAATDEALRIRRKGAQLFLTYKGPKLDATTKTRNEIDLPFTGDPDQWHALLAALGFRPVAEVRKQRRKARLEAAGRPIEISLDQVAGVGQYVELEIVTTIEQVDAAREALAQLARELGLTENERRSYLELLLAAQSA